MVFRELREADFEKIKEASEALGFPVPNFTEAIFQGVVVDENDEFIAYGQVKTIVESILVESEQRSKTERVAALRYLMIEAMRATKKAGHSSLHGFVKETKFSQILKKHYGFEPCKGEALILHF